MFLDCSSTAVLKKLSVKIQKTFLNNVLGLFKYSCSYTMLHSSWTSLNLRTLFRVAMLSTKIIIVLI